MHYDEKCIETVNELCAWEYKNIQLHVDHKVYLNGKTVSKANRTLIEGTLKVQVSKYPMFVTITK